MRPSHHTSIVAVTMLSVRLRPCYPKSPRRVSVRVPGDERGDRVGRTVGRSLLPSGQHHPGGNHVCFVPRDPNAYRAEESVRSRGDGCVGLTKRTVDRLSVNGKDAVFWDNELPGFGVRVYPSGKKVFVVQTRAFGRSKRVSLGTHGDTDFSVDHARRKATDVIARIKDGLPAVAPEPAPDPTVADRGRQRVQPGLRPARTHGDGAAPGLGPRARHRKLTGSRASRGPYVERLPAKRSMSRRRRASAHAPRRGSHTSQRQGPDTQLRERARHPDARRAFDRGRRASVHRNRIGTGPPDPLRGEGARTTPL